MLGNHVRFDGGHKKNRFLTDHLSEYFEFVSFCPEAGIGMGIPRPPIRLVEFDGQIRAKGIKDPETDKTEELAAYAESSKSLFNDVCGVIFKKDSPSCGYDRVKVYDVNNVPKRKGQGIYAEAISGFFPQLPAEDEGRLMDPVLRENFIERVFIYYRWQSMRSALTAEKLVEFHSRHKFNILAHDEVIYRKLGQLVAEAGVKNIDELADDYFSLLMDVLKKPSTRKTHTNVLMHVMGFIKNNLDSDDKSEWLSVLDDYRLGRLPLIVPVTLLRHYLRRFPQPYIEQQYYINPYPDELMLRNML